MLSQHDAIKQNKRAGKPIHIWWKKKTFLNNARLKEEPQGTRDRRATPSASRRTETNTRAEMNEIEKRKVGSWGGCTGLTSLQQASSETRREDTSGYDQMKKLASMGGKTTTDTSPSAAWMSWRKQTNQFLKRHNLPELPQGETDVLNGPISINESITCCFQDRKHQTQDGLTRKFHQGRNGPTFLWCLLEHRSGEKTSSLILWGH